MEVLLRVMDSMDHPQVEEAEEEEEEEEEDEACGSAEAAAARNGDGKEERVIAKGISLVLGPLINGFQAGVEGAIRSQCVFSSRIDRLTRELDKLLEDAPLPFVAQYATKISGVRKRVVSICSTLDIIQKRIDNIEQMLSGVAKLKHGPESSSTRPNSVMFISQHTDTSSVSNDAGI